MRPHHKVLQDIAREFGCESYLEIGVSEGDSLRALLEVVHPQEIVLCDTWGGLFGGTMRGSHDHIDALLDSLEFQGIRNFLDGDSKGKIPAFLASNDIDFDLVLVDGDHSYEGAWTDLRNVWPVISDGGFLVFDDIIHPSHKYLLTCAREFQRQWHNADLYFIDRMNGNGAVAFRKTPDEENPSWN